MSSNRVYNLTKQKPLPLSASSSITFLFYISKLFGLAPYSISDYISKKKLEISPFGNVFCIISCIFYALLYHFMMTDTMVAFQDKNARVTSLTEVIGLIIIYLEPLMMAIDIIAAIVNQSSLIDVFHRLQMIDERLANENIFLNFKFIRKFSIALILFAIFWEFGLTVMNLMIFLDELAIWKSIVWLLTSVPLFINFVAKVWFLCLILLIRQRLMAINKHLSDLADSFVEKKSKFGKNEIFVQTVEFLRNEIIGPRNVKGKNFGWEVKNIQVVAPYKENGKSERKKLQKKI